MIVTDPIAMGGNRECCHALHKACGKPPKPAIAECSVWLELAQLFKINAEPSERFPGLVDHLHVGERINQKTADQKFEAEIVNALAPAALDLVVGRDPAFDNPVADRQRCRDKPIARPRCGNALADGIGQFVDNGAADLGDTGLGFHGAASGRSGLAWCGRFKIGLHRGGPPTFAQGSRSEARPALRMNAGHAFSDPFLELLPVPACGIAGGAILVAATIGSATGRRKLKPRAHWLRSKVTDVAIQTGKKKA